MVKRIAFIGLGNMGLPMAINLVKSGFVVFGSDMNKAALEKLVSVGGIAAESNAKAVQSADAVVTMLPNADIVRSVYEGDAGLIANARAGTLFLDCSTIDVETARSVIATAEAKGMYMLDAPVSGGVAGAEAGTLAFMCGGSEDAFMLANPVLEPMSGKIVFAGAAGNGQAAKVCNNMLLAISMIGVSEAFNLGRALGLADRTFFDIASNASGQCWSLTSYCPVPGPVKASPANRDYEPGFATALMLKDLNLAREAFLSAGVNAPLGERSAEIYKAMDAAGMGDKDFSAVINYLAENK